MAGGRTSSIATQRGGVNVVVPAAGSGAGTQRPTFTSALTEDPAKLSQQLNQLVRHVEDSTKSAASSPLAGTTNILRNVALTSGATSVIQHMLGRELNGYFCVRAQDAAFSAFEPTGAVAIASSTNASPIEVTTSSVHNLSTGQRVAIVGHAVNTAAQGTWSIDVVSTTKYTLRGSTGNGVGGATGTGQLTGYDRRKEIVLRSAATGTYDLLVF